MNGGNLDFESSSPFFEAKYQKSSDPWNFSGDPYELSRYEAIIAAISHKRYVRAFEPGCSIGVLTEQLAEHCDEVHAIDFSATAVEQAQTRCAHRPNVSIRCGGLEANVPGSGTDLLVLSEIGYYFDVKEWRRISSALINSLHAGATVLAAHWLGFSEDHRISGDEVHRVLLAHPELQAQHTARNDSMRLDRLVRR